MRKINTLFFVILLSFLFTDAFGKWELAYTDSKRITTKDHHCLRKCKGEPTRTSYVIELQSDKGMRLRNPRLRCISGPCGGWNEIKSVHIENKGTKAVALFDVWSRTTTWILTADVFENTN